MKLFSSDVYAEKMSIFFGTLYILQATNNFMFYFRKINSWSDYI